MRCNAPHKKIVGLRMHHGQRVADLECGHVAYIQNQFRGRLNDKLPCFKCADKERE